MEILNQENDTPRVLVVQNGARHNYAVPRALAERGLLSGFYTDACGNEGVGRLLAGLASWPGAGRRFSLLKKREVPADVLPATRSFPVSMAVEQLLAQRLGSFPQGHLLGMAMALQGTGDANMVYSSFGWSPVFLAHAREQGLHVVTEFYIKPSFWKLHQEECRRFPEWEEMPGYLRQGEDLTERLRQETCALTDDVVVPTQAVKEDVAAECLFPAERIHVVPYGLDEVFFKAVNRPRAGNVLYVGSCTLMKGIHYLAGAARKLQPDTGGNAGTTLTAAGDVSGRILKMAAGSGIQFLGRVPRMEVARLYEMADVLVFPTLSDSFGMVMLEAMAAGIPVICSPYGADVVEHGVSGLVVDPRDTAAWAEAMRMLTCDRPLRDRMAAAARERARQYTGLRYAEQLTGTLKDIHARVQTGGVQTVMKAG